MRTFNVALCESALMYSLLPEAIFVVAGKQHYFHNFFLRTYIPAMISIFKKNFKFSGAVVLAVQLSA